jgi:hypothetical protein
MTPYNPTMYSMAGASLRNIFAPPSNIPHQSVLKIITANSNFITPEIY